MTFVCLANLAGPTTRTSPAELAPALLDVVPRIKVEGEAPCIWADVRGLDAPTIADRLLVRLRDLGCAHPRAGVARTPVAAGVAARYGSEPLVVVPPSGDREFLAPHRVSVLAPDDGLTQLLAGTGIERCGDLARLDQASVEVIYGAEGVAFWRLARGDDSRLIFDAAERALPDAALDWTDYVLRDSERLLFVINRLVLAVCDRLTELGQGATAFTLAFALANGTRVEQPFHPSRASADVRTWLRLARHRLDGVRLPDAVTGVALRVDAVAPIEAVQGDVLDRGFATAKAAEDALARVLDHGGVLVTPDLTRHPLPGRRSRWVEQPPALVWARPQVAPEDTLPRLALHLLPAPETVTVETVDRRGFPAPLRYTARDGCHDLVTASGPDCVSGGEWEEEPYAYELYCCVRTDGEIVLLAREAREGTWEVVGVWR